MNSWHPIKDSTDLKTLGKLGEECGELSAIVSRCIIQGVQEQEPVTRKYNNVALEQEIADVQANIDLVIQRFSLDTNFIAKRRAEKKEKLLIWHRM